MEYTKPKTLLSLFVVTIIGACVEAAISVLLTGAIIIPLYYKTSLASEPSLDGLAAVYLVYFAGAFGAVVGALAIHLGWFRYLIFNLSVVAFVATISAGFLLQHREAFFPTPRVESVGNFELANYANQYKSNNCARYEVRYRGTTLSFNGQTDLGCGTSVWLISTGHPRPSAPNSLVLNVVEENRDSLFYLVHEDAGKATVLSLCSSTHGAYVGVDWLGQTDKLTRRWPNRQLMSAGGRWLLLADECVLDAHTGAVYQVDLTSSKSVGSLSIDEMHVPIGLSPDQQSFVRVMWSNPDEARGLHLLVYNFMRGTHDVIRVNRTIMPYDQRLRPPGRGSATGYYIDTINAEWLMRYFRWEVGPDGYDRLLPRTQSTP